MVDSHPENLLLFIILFVLLILSILVSKILLRDAVPYNKYQGQRRDIQSTRN